MNACFPIINKDIWDMYKKAQSCFWVAEEINLYEDLNDWAKLNDNERYFISMVLGFFSEADSIVNLNLEKNLIPHVSEFYKEAGYIYSFQLMMENIHNETYSLIIDTLIKNNEEKSKLFQATKNFDIIKNKNEWAMRHIKETDLARNIIAFIIVEGLFFSGSFCSLFWLKDRGLMKGLTFSNELISRDEGLHVEFGIHMYNKMVNDNHIRRLTESEIHHIFQDAVKTEQQFICGALPVSLLGMNIELMGQYIEYVADYLLNKLYYTKLYNVKNPFPFMENISLQGKTNFFERKNSEYVIPMDNSIISFEDDIDY